MRKIIIGWWLGVATAATLIVVNASVSNAPVVNPPSWAYRVCVQDDVIGEPQIENARLEHGGWVTMSFPRPATIDGLTVYVVRLQTDEHLLRYSLCHPWDTNDR